MQQNTQLIFLPFTTELAPYFKQINRQWIEQMFTLEVLDEAMLHFPQKHIIDTGGYIWFAKHPTLGVIGTCALMQREPGEYELTKMAVLACARNLKVGEKLLQHVLQQIPNIVIKQLFLLTNKKCQAAIHLYQKNGFLHSPKIMSDYGHAYERCDVAMFYPLVKPSPS
ncbi:MAG: N-acetylglutamate synthase-like GNAT family acetyltransferase [Paraglaciecola sp.]|jgi:N-acetylglutamate synthase-like GNAT family acetyltransferase